MHILDHGQMEVSTSIVDQEGLPNLNLNRHDDDTCDQVEV